MEDRRPLLKKSKKEKILGWYKEADSYKERRAEELFCVYRNT